MTSKVMQEETGKLLTALAPLGAAIGGVSLVGIHEIVSIVVLCLTGVYTIFKIKKDFFTKK